MHSEAIFQLDYNSRHGYQWQCCPECLFVRMLHKLDRRGFSKDGRLLWKDILHRFEKRPIVGINVPSNCVHWDAPMRDP